MKHSRTVSGLYIYESSSHDVYLNLAREEYLFDNLPKGSRSFLVYVDSPSVVFGKHQNPWRECSVAVLKEQGIPLVRRISGGGTVYHDLGNLNFSFLLPKTGFDRRKNLALIVQSLGRLGIRAEISERHDIMVGNQKISGNAFCFRRERALHHGTLLIRSELDALRGSLAGTAGIETFAVESNRASVMNIAVLRPQLDLRAVASSLIEEVASRWEEAGLPARQVIDERVVDNEEVRALAKRNRTDEWVFGRTPKFTITLKFPGQLLSGNTASSTDTVQLKLGVEKGHILSSALHGSVGFTVHQLDLLSKRLAGLRFDSSVMSDALAGIDELSRFSAWIRGRGF